MLFFRKGITSVCLVHFVALMIICTPNKVNAQYSWDWKDPNDLNVVDFGDNKVIAYNLIGLGLVMLFDKKNRQDSSNLWSISAGNFYEYRRRPLSKIITLEVRTGKPTRRYLNWGAGFRLNSIYGAGQRTTGLGTFLWFSWHIIHKDRWRLTYDNGVGPNYFIDPFPAGGTRFNFTTHYGLEIALKLRSRWLSLELGNVHISNANIRGADRNPALDAIGLQLAYQF